MFRKSDVHLLYPTIGDGHFHQIYRVGNSIGIEEKISDQFKSEDYTSLTSDTLKRNRRMNRQSSFLHQMTNDNKRSDKFANLSERYKSSPDLLHEDIKDVLADWSKKRTQNILKHTTWHTTGSLITLNLSSDDSEIIIEENIVTDDRLADDDSGYYGDSDSGVSSLYETINIMETNQGSEQLNPFIKQQDDKGQCAEIFTNNNHILQKLDPSLQHIFIRDHRRIIQSEEFGFELNILEKLYVLTESDCGDVNGSCCIRHLTKVLTTRQTLLNQNCSELNEELQILDENLSNIEYELSKSTKAGELKLFQRTVNKISPIVNLIFGLELRLGDILCTNSSVLRMRLSEARCIRHRHEDSLLTVGRIVRDRLGVARQLELRSHVRNKQRAICMARVVRREIYWVETQMKLLFDLRL